MSQGSSDVWYVLIYDQYTQSAKRSTLGRLSPTASFDSFQMDDPWADRSITYLPSSTTSISLSTPTQSTVDAIIWPNIDEDWCCPIGCPCMIRSALIRMGVISAEEDDLNG